MRQREAGKAWVGNGAVPSVSLKESGQERPLARQNVLPDPYSLEDKSA